MSANDKIEYLGYDDEEEGNASKPVPQRDIKIPYEFGARVTTLPKISNELTIPQLQDLIIQRDESGGVCSEEYIRSVDNKESLLRLLNWFTFGPDDSQGIPLEQGPLEVPWESVQIGQRIDNGVYGTVYFGTIFGTTCAIKHLRGARSMSMIKKEIHIAYKNYHPNIVSLMCYAQKKTDFLLVMPRMVENLQSYIRKNPIISLIERLAICQQILLGLNWLHSQKPAVLHLDIKMANVLVDDTGKMRFSDFGLSAVLVEDASHVQAASRTPGNVGHMAPEVIANESFNTKADVYGIAVLMWEILKGHEWEAEIVQQLMREFNIRVNKSTDLKAVVKRGILSRGLRPCILNTGWPKSLIELLSDMWQRDPNRRPTVNAVLSHRLPVVLRDLTKDLLSESMVDQKGQEFWSTNFSANPELPVDWNEFKALFYDYVGCELPANEEDRSDIGVQRLLALKVALNAARSQCVTLKAFGCVMDAFGPMSDGFSFLNRIYSALLFPWFRPDLNQEEAVDVLMGQEDGSFVVRFSSGKGVPFSLTRLQDGKVRQIRVGRKPDGKLFSTKTKGEFESIGEMFSSRSVREDFNLKLNDETALLGVADLLFMDQLEDVGYLHNMGSLGNDPVGNLSSDDDGPGFAI